MSQMMQDFWAKVRALNSEGEHGASLAHWEEFLKTDPLAMLILDATKDAPTFEEYFAREHGDS